MTLGEIESPGVVFPLILADLPIAFVPVLLIMFVFAGRGG
jgi:hypothetical protein